MESIKKSRKRLQELKEFKQSDYELSLIIGFEKDLDEIEKEISSN